MDSSSTAELKTKIVKLLLAFHEETEGLELRIQHYPRINRVFVSLHNSKSTLRIQVDIESNEDDLDQIEQSALEKVLGQIVAMANESLRRSRARLESVQGDVTDAQRRLTTLEAQIAKIEAALS